MKGKIEQNDYKISHAEKPKSRESKSILEILRNRKGMVFAVLLAAVSATGGCRGCSCDDEKGTEDYYGCDAENNRFVCGTREIDNNNKR